MSDAVKSPPTAAEMLVAWWAYERRRRSSVENSVATYPRPRDGAGWLVWAIDVSKEGM